MVKAAALDDMPQPSGLRPSAGRAVLLLLLLLCGLGGCDLSLGDYPYCYFCGNGEVCPPGSSCGPNAYCLLPDGGEAGPADGGCQ